MIDISFQLLLSSEVEDSKWAGRREATRNPYIILMVINVGWSRRRENMTLFWIIRKGAVRMGGGWIYSRPYSLRWGGLVLAELNIA
jgi:hypothetical protein